MMVWKMILLFQGCILSFHVNLPGCKQIFGSNTSFSFLCPSDPISNIGPQVTSSIGTTLYRLESMGKFCKSQYHLDWKLSTGPGLPARWACRECGIHCLRRISCQAGWRGNQFLCLPGGNGSTWGHAGWIPYLETQNPAKVVDYCRILDVTR